jgi:hypothetical protein
VFRNEERAAVFVITGDSMKKEEVIRLRNDLRRADLESRVLRFLKYRLPENLYEELRDELLCVTRKKKLANRPPSGGWVWD